MPIETIHMPLMNEGTVVWRPVEAEKLVDGTFRILGPVPADEEWMYQPGAVVVAKHCLFGNGTEGLVAERSAVSQASRFAQWDAVAKEIAQSIAASADPFDAATIVNVHDLVTVCRTQCPLPEGTKKGYWSTISIWWPSIEVEVFDDHLELYRFSNGSTGIQHFDHSPGAQFRADFLDQLPRLEAPHD
jgi:hypothetical protein